MAAESLTTSGGTLYPQVFPSTAVTLLPEIDFYDYAFQQLPLIYQNAANFCGMLKAISSQKQNLYDIIRSLVNVYNLNDAGNLNPQTVPSGKPTGVYLKMLASVFNSSYSDSYDDVQITSIIQQSVIFINSRGLPSDFYKYFVNVGMEYAFTNGNVEEDGNATIFFNVPVSNNPVSQSSCNIQIIVNSAPSPPYTIPAGWQVGGIATTSPYVTINSYTIVGPGTYFVTVYSSDSTTVIQIGALNSGSLIPGVTFTCMNIGPASLAPINPYSLFVTAMSRLKAAGIYVIINATNIPLFQYGSLPEDSPPLAVAPGNAGFGILLGNGQVVNGGFYASL